MFKDYDKYLSVSLKVYLILLVFIFILKIVGLDYFGLDMNNSLVLMIDSFVFKYKLENIYYFITLYIFTIFIIGLVFKRNDKEIKLLALIYTIIGILIKIIENKVGLTYVNCVIDFMYLLFMILLTNIKLKEDKVVKRFIAIFIINFLYQFITFIIRSINYTEQNSFILNAILNIDYLLMLLITYKLYFMKGGFKLCGMEVGSYLQMKKKFSNLHIKLQNSLDNFKKLDKEMKLTYIIYFIFSLIWNIFTIIVVLFIAKLNDTFIECLFILSSFWISKKMFGKAFHLKSMLGCFILSNSTYYVLNRITTPIGISIIVPIMLGVGLSYITSKFVRKLKPLYKGMSEELFDESILNVVDKHSMKYKVCYDYFVKKENAVFLGRKYNYSEAGIRKIADRVNKSIKEFK